MGWPRGLAVDSIGNLYIADFTGCRVRRFAKDAIISTVAGNGVCNASSGDGGNPLSACLSYPPPSRSTFSGAVFVLESDRVWKFSPGGIIAAVAAGLDHPTGVA